MNPEAVKANCFFIILGCIYEQVSTIDVEV